MLAKEILRLSKLDCTDLIKTPLYKKIVVFLKKLNTDSRNITFNLGVEFASLCLLMALRVIDLIVSNFNFECKEFRINPISLSFNLLPKVIKRAIDASTIDSLIL